MYPLPWRRAELLCRLSGGWPAPCAYLRSQPIASVCVVYLGVSASVLAPQLLALLRLAGVCGISTASYIPVPFVLGAAVCKPGCL